MKVRSGYKWSEVGVIPEEWETSSLFEVVDCLDNLRVPLNDAQRQKMQGDFPYCGANGVLDYIRDFVVDDDIILMAEDGGYFDEHTTRPIAYRMRGKCWVNNHAHILKAKPGYDQGFLFYSLVHKNILPFLSSGTRAKLNKSEMGKIVVPVPPTEVEQRAIAEALGDMDNLISALDKLIAKKRNIKQAVMQQLLTGKTRLPGFKGEWETVTLGTIGKFSKGRGIRKDESGTGEIPCIRYGEIYTHHDDIVRSFNSNISEQVAATSRCLSKGDLLFAGSGETKKEIGKCVAFVGSTRAYVGGDIVILSPRNQDSRFLGYALNSEAVVRQKTSRSQGDAVVHITASALSEVALKLPSLPEQSAIAEVLTDMDEELSLLEKRLKKTRNIKQSMMQELLTGKTRLV